MASRKPPADPGPTDPDETTESSPSTGDSDPAGSEGSPSTASADGPTPNRFFSWMRELAVPRQPGWIGGVAAGIGQRIGIDPIIVRGIIVVVAVLGGPALLLYAAAWLLLPDSRNRIHAEELGRGRLDPALIGIGVMAALSFLPLNQGFWWAGATFWGDMSLAASFGRAIWTAVLLAGIVTLIIVLARRGDASTTVVPATTDDKPDTIPIAVPPTEAGPDATAENAEQVTDQAAETTTVTEPEASALSGVPPEAPPAPAAGADDDELQAWKERQALWKQQHAEWKAQQAATERQLRQQRALEAHEKALAASAERAEQRRLRRLANPRISAATAWAVLGVAIIAGGIAALVSTGNPDVGGHEATIALGVSAITLGVAGIVAGALRHRSGVLGFFALIAVIAMLVSAAIPRDRQLFMWGVSWGVGGDTRIAVPVGPLYLSVHDSPASGITDIWQGSGLTELWVAEGASVQLELVSASGDITTYDDRGRGVSIGEGVSGVQKFGDDYYWTVILGPELEPERTIRLEQDGGRLVVYDENTAGSALTEVPDDNVSDEGVQQ